MTLTPEQFNKLVTKDYLDERLENFESKFATKDNIRDIVDTLDYIVKKIDKIDAEQTANQAAHDRMQETAENHEIRIEKLELKTAS